MHPRRATNDQYDYLPNGAYWYCNTADTNILCATYFRVFVSVYPVLAPDARLITAVKVRELTQSARAIRGVIIEPRSYSRPQIKHHSHWVLMPDVFSSGEEVPLNWSVRDRAAATLSAVAERTGFDRRGLH
ncbi:hypothetical protein DFH09DRAFT_1067767 [Mycena vulgaris]|nr:hypothetical protein DFH09DRAFT_1067767 [Mycena vulgaris]